MYAVVETGGKQYRVQEGDVISVEKLNVEDGAKVVFDKVLVAGEGADIKVGKPYIEGCTVEGTAVESGKGPKVIIFKYKAKKDYRKKQGHRQPYTSVKIESLNIQSILTRWSFDEPDRPGELHTGKFEDL